MGNLLCACAQYISEFMAKLKGFAKSYACHVFLVAHPKQRANWRGEVRLARCPAPPPAPAGDPRAEQRRAARSDMRGSHRRPAARRCVPLLPAAAVGLLSLEPCG